MLMQYLRTFAGLQEFFEADQIPTYFGGTYKTDPPHPVYPKSVPLHLRSNVHSHEKPFLYVHAAKRTHMVYHKSDETSANLNYVLLFNQPFIFGVFFTKDGAEMEPEKMEPLTPEFRPLAQAKFLPETAEIDARRSGFYHVVFNNRKARFISLKVKGHVELTSGKEPRRKLNCNVVTVDGVIN